MQARAKLATKQTPSREAGSSDGTGFGDSTTAITEDRVGPDLRRSSKGTTPARAASKAARLAAKEVCRAAEVAAAEDPLVATSVAISVVGGAEDRRVVLVARTAK